ncbi:MAG: Coenzyme F420 hydrogenase/dehydrogenase, beta subunit C-terminal domain [Thermodesulfobacteriota bacterium]
MKTFFDLVQQVQKPGLCHHCGGCVTFCTAINFGALKQDPEGKPVYADMEKCIECGICYMICPEIGELEEETKGRLSWKLPMGRVLETAVARSRDAAVLKRATDGGVVTTLLLSLFDSGRIDGAIVTRKKGLFLREPHLATTRREILEAAGFFFDASHGMSLYSETYSTFSAGIQMLGQMTKKGMRRVAFVGTPCQVKTIRKMETLGIVPTDSIKYVFGLFCSGNFQFGAAQREQLEKMGGFSWNEVRKVNVKEKLMIHLDSGQVIELDMDELSFMKRYACQFCDDYSAELADISFGGIGAAEGWTTVITRTPMGRAMFAHARSENVMEEFARDKNPRYVSDATAAVESCSQKKRERATKRRAELEAKAVKVSG